MLENVRKGHPQLTQPELMELTQDLPSPKDVYLSYCKLRDLCTPGMYSETGICKQLKFSHSFCHAVIVFC